MTVVSMNYLLEAGTHFGHQKRRWNPKMREYIFTTRDDIYIIDLQKTVKLLEEAYKEVKKIAERGGTFLFVGTKKQAQEAVFECAERVDMFYVNERWLGGTLTNFRTIKSRVRRMEEIEQMEQDGTFDALTKKEVAKLEKEYDKLNRNLGGIREMTKLPDALIVVDPNTEDIAIREARKLNIPIFAIVDTNADPDVVDYVIPGNDDAIRSVKLLVGVLTNAIAEVNGKELEDFLTEEDKTTKVEVKEVKEEKQVEVKDEPKVKEEREIKEEPKAKEDKVEVKEEVKTETEDLTTLTVVKLKEMAKEKGIEGYSKLRKAELIEVLTK